MPGRFLIMKSGTLRDLELAKQLSVADATHLELNGSGTVGECGLEHDLRTPWAKAPVEDHAEIAPEALKPIGPIHHHQIQWLGVRSPLIGKQGQPTYIPSIACDGRILKGILPLQLGRRGLASVSSLQP